MGKLEGKVAVITGANSGIGLASAKRFASEGARVFMTGRRQAELDKAVSEVGHDARGVQGDVASLADLDRLYRVVREEAGRIDVLFANAGSGELMRLSDITEEHYERTFATNVKGTLFTVQKALPLLRHGASVILTGSANGNKGGASFSVYSATKGGDPQLRPELDPGSGPASHPRECARPWGDLDPGPAWALSHGRGKPCRRGYDGGGSTGRPHGAPGRDRGCCAVSCVGRQQLRQRQRVVR